MENTSLYFETINTWHTFEVWTNASRSGQRMVVRVPPHIQSGWTATIYQGVDDHTGRPTVVLDADAPEVGHPDRDEPKLITTAFVKNGNNIAAALYQRRNQMWLYVVASNLDQTVYTARWIPFDPPLAPQQRYPLHERTYPRNG